MLIVGSRARLKRTTHDIGITSRRIAIESGELGTILNADHNAFRVEFPRANYTGWFVGYDLEEVGPTLRDTLLPFKVGDTLRIKFEWSSMSYIHRLAWKNNYPLEVTGVNETDPIGYVVQYWHDGGLYSMSIGRTVVEKYETPTEFKVGDRVKLDPTKEFFIAANMKRAHEGTVGVVHGFGKGTILVTFPGVQYPYTLDSDTVIKVGPALEVNADPAKKYLDGINEEIAEIERLLKADSAKVKELLAHMEIIKDNRRVLRKLKKTWEDTK